MRVILIAAAVAALVGSAAFAHEHAGHGEHLFRADSNNDGAVTRAEFDQARGAMFARVDTDHDGQLERGEHHRGRGMHGEGHHMEGTGRHMSAADANNDGAISRDEFLARPLEMFARLDANGDGSISVEEQTAARGRHQEMRGARHERREQRREHMREADADHDHQLSQAEFTSLGDRMFERLDADRDGAITRQEAEAHHAPGH